MLQQPLDRFEARDVGGVADPFAERAAMADGDGADAGGAGGRQPRRANLRGPPSTCADEPEPFERKLIGVRGRLDRTSRPPCRRSYRTMSARPAASRTASMFSRQVPETTARRTRPCSFRTRSTTPG